MTQIVSYEKYKLRFTILSWWERQFEEDIWTQRLSHSLIQSFRLQPRQLSYTATDQLTAFQFKVSSLFLSFKNLNVFPIRGIPDITVTGRGSCPRYIVSNAVSENEEEEEGTSEDHANTSFSSEVDTLESSNQVDPFSEDFLERKLGETNSSCFFGCYLKALKRIVGKLSPGDAVTSKGLIGASWLWMLNI